MRLGLCESGTLRRALTALGATLGLCAPLTAQSTAPLRSPLGLAGQLDASAGECCIMLLFPIGARGAALGESMTAMTSPEAVFHNPAGLAELDASHFVLHHVANQAQQIDAFSLIIRPFNVATLGLSYQLIDFGDEEATNPDGIPIGRITIRDHVLVASLATSVVAGVSAGVSYKMYNARWTCSGSCGGIDVDALTHGLDVGVQYQPYWLAPLRIGVALVNAGFPLQVVNRRQSDPMPTRLRVGVAYDVMQHITVPGDYQLWVLVDAQEDDWKSPSSPETSLGMELLVGQAVYLRAGYGAGEGVTGGPSVGVGLVYSSFHFGVAKRLDGGQGLFGDDPFQLSLGVGF